MVFYLTRILLHLLCESRVEKTREESGSNPAKDMDEQSGRRTNLGSGLDIGLRVEPIKEALDLLA